VSYRGYIQKGVVVLDEPANLEDGTLVRVEVVSESATSAPAPRSLAERLAPVIGKAQTLPPDASEQHDHYLYATPKK
jgi:hypothetical protein